MSEIYLSQSEISKSEAARRLGRIVERTGKVPPEGIRKLVTSDPKLEDSFLQGAQEVQQEEQEKNG